MSRVPNGESARLRRRLVDLRRCGTETPPAEPVAKSMTMKHRVELRGTVTMAQRAAEIKVFISTNESKCDECGEELGRRAWITLAGDQVALCLACADLDHLVFLRRGDAALTRRSKKYSKLWAVILKWSRARKRYERQGLLVEAAALEKASAESSSPRSSPVVLIIRQDVLDVFVCMEFAGAHAVTDLATFLDESRVALEEILDQVVVQRKNRELFLAARL